MALRGRRRDATAVADERGFAAGPTFRRPGPAALYRAGAPLPCGGARIPAHGTNRHDVQDPPWVTRRDDVAVTFAKWNDARVAGPRRCRPVDAPRWTSTSAWNLPHSGRSRVPRFRRARQFRFTRPFLLFFFSSWSNWSKFHSNFHHERACRHDGTAERIRGVAPDRLDT